MLVLVAIVFSALFKPGKQDESAGHWKLNEDQAAWEPAIRMLDADQAIELIQDSIPRAERARAIVILLDDRPIRAADLAVPQLPSAPPATGLIEDDPQQQLEQVRQERAAAREELGLVSKAEAILDDLPMLPETLSAYASVVSRYDSMGMQKQATDAFMQLSERMKKSGGMFERLWLWFEPLFRERIGLLACGVMAVLVYTLRPAIDLWAKAFALRLYDKSTDEYIQRALNQAPKPKLDLSAKMP